MPGLLMHHQHRVFAKDAAILVNPESSNDIAEALLRLSADKDLRTELKQAGLERAEKFSWQKTAEQTLNIYRELNGEQS